MLRQEFHSSAFPLEFREKTTQKSLYKHVEAYLGEYRYNISLYAYEYYFAKDQFFQHHLIDPNTDESMITKEQRGLNKRRVEGKNTEREIAEFCGIELLEEKLINANIGDTIVWASPPPINKEEGYGDYGFFFIGLVDDNTQNGKHISMLARRVDHPTINGFNSAMSKIIGRQIAFEKPEDFLASPFVIKPGVGELEPENEIEKIFGPINPDSLDQFNKTMQLLNPLVNKFIDSVQNKEPLFIQKKLLNAIENLTLKGQDSLGSDELYNISNNPHFIDIALFKYSQKPPIAAGSCGSTGNSASSFQTSNLFNKLSLDNSPLTKLLSSDEDDYKNDPNLCRCNAASGPHFHCPGNNEGCKHPIVVGEGTTQCPSCGLQATCP